MDVARRVSNLNSTEQSSRYHWGSKAHGCDLNALIAKDFPPGGSVTGMREVCLKKSGTRFNYERQSYAEGVDDLTPPRKCPSKLLQAVSVTEMSAYS